MNRGGQMNKKWIKEQAKRFNMTEQQFLVWFLSVRKR